MIERLRDEQGIGLPLAMSVLVIVMLAAALTAANSAAKQFATVRFAITTT